MGRTSLVGAFGLGRQASKDTLASTITYLPATSIGLNINQNAQTLPPEVGGDYFLRGSYKSSVMGGGDVAAVARPNSLGNFFYALAGQDTVTPVPAQSGAYSHSFTPFTPSPGVDLPLYTLIKDVAKIQNVGATAALAEQYLNAKMSSFRLDVPKSSIATVQSSWVATTPSTVTVASLGAETMDSTPQFQTCNGTIAFIQEGGSTISANSLKVERLAFNYANNVSQDEFSVGNYYLEDITLLQRTVTVDMDFVVRDTALYQAVYMNAGTIPGAWSPQIYRGALTLTLNSTVNVPTTTQPYQLVLTFPGLDFMMLPIQLSGADLVRATLSTQVTLGSSGADRFAVTLVNGVASY